jgi:hypothetical protein
MSHAMRARSGAFRGAGVRGVTACVSGRAAARYARAAPAAALRCGGATRTGGRAAACLPVQSARVWSMPIVTWGDMHRRGQTGHVSNHPPPWMTPVRGRARQGARGGCGCITRCTEVRAGVDASAARAPCTAAGTRWRRRRTGRRTSLAPAAARGGAARGGRGETHC